MLPPHSATRLLACLALLLPCSGPAVGHHPHAVAAEDGYRDGVHGGLGAHLTSEAMKTGILQSVLGMDVEPTPTGRASHWDVRGNTSRSTRGRTAVLLPASVVPLQLSRNAEHHVQWYRAVFQKKPHLRSELMLARAHLTISRSIATDEQAVGIPLKLHVKVNGRSVINSAAQRNTAVSTDASGMQHLTVDVRPWAEAWGRAAGGRPLVVDVGWERPPATPPGLALEMGVASERGSRRPRSAKEDACGEQGWCCRRSVSVAFKDIGWSDWVVAPAAYTMHFCDGACPHNYKPASMHTQVKSRLHHASKGGLPRPCCVPAAYEPMVLMHYDSRGKLTVSPFNDLLVSKCHCA